MDELLKQMRERISGVEEESPDDKYKYNTREGRIPPQKTTSFKGERKKAPSRFQKQFSAQMNDIDDLSDAELEAAIAAAAYAIASMEVEESPNQRKPMEEFGRSLNKTKSKTRDSMKKPTDPYKISRWLTGKEAKEDGRSTGESSLRKSFTLEQRMMENSTANRKMPEKAMGSIPSIKKTPTFSDKYLNDSASKSLEEGVQSTANRKMTEKAKGRAPSIKKTPTFSDKYLNDSVSKSFEEGMQDMRGGQSENFKYPDTIKSRKEETKADAWEREKMAKIRKQYEKMNSKILEWEHEKKLKAKRQVERKEREIEKRRARILQEHRNEISRIDKIASGARVVSDERKRNEEIKTREKAKRIREMGKVPRKCFCC